MAVTVDDSALEPDLRLAWEMFNAAGVDAAPDALAREPPQLVLLEHNRWLTPQPPVNMDKLQLPHEHVSVQSSNKQSRRPPTFLNKTSNCGANKIANVECAGVCFDNAPLTNHLPTSFLLTYEEGKQWAL